MPLIPLVENTYTPFSENHIHKFVNYLLEDFFSANGIVATVDETGLQNLKDIDLSTLVQATYIRNSLLNKDWSMDCQYPLVHKHYEIKIYQTAPGTEKREELKDIMDKLKAFTVSRTQKTYSIEVDTANSISLKTTLFQNRVIREYMTDSIQEGEKSNKILGVVEILFNIHI